MYWSLEGPEIYNIGTTFHDRHTTRNTRCCDFKNLVKVDPSRATKPRIRNENCKIADSVLLI